MYGEDKFGKPQDPGTPPMRCSEFEALMADALEGTLTGNALDAFEAHRHSCGNCAPMYAEAEAGLRWLDALKGEEVEPPARLMQNILRATTWADLPAKEAAKPWWQRLREHPYLAPVLGTVLQPRFAMSFAMAFFSITMVFSISGLDLRDLRHVDLRPQAVMRDISETHGKVVHYYENIRFVYEIESRVRDLKRATTPEEPAQRPQQQKEQKDNRTGKPDQEQYRNYSLEESRPLLAAVHGAVRQEDRRWL